MWKRLFRRTSAEQELDDEIRAHLEIETRLRIEAGASPDDARAAAARDFGSVALVKEVTRGMWGWTSLERLKQDLGFGLRILRKSPGFTIVAVLTLALGIGANTAIFSVINGLLIRSLPFPRAGELVWIENAAGEDGGPSAITHQSFTYRDLARDNRTFTDLAAYDTFYPYVTYNLTGSGEPERLLGVDVTGNFFSLLGVAPALGRAFTREECVRTGRHVVILSDRFWKARFAADRSIVGRTFTINGDPMVVVGVMPSTFDFASIFVPGGKADIFVPRYIDQQSDQNGNELSLIGRLKPGVSLQAAQSDLSALTARYARERGYPIKARLQFLEDHVTGNLRHSLFVLAAAVGFVLLIACANLSNLLLARAAARRKEIALRLALGASRLRLLRQMLTESTLLSVCGGLVGLPLAVWATRMLADLQRTSIPMLGQVRVDANVFLFTLAVSALTGFVFGAVPAMQASRSAVNESLKEGTAGAGGALHRSWTRTALVVWEVALSFVLLGGAGLMMKSLAKLLESDAGFRSDHVAIVRIDPGPQVGDKKRLTLFLDQVVARVRAIPGVEAASVTDAVPLDRDRSWGTGVVGQVYPRDQYPNAFVRAVGTDYFRVMRIPVLAGRVLDEHDTADKERVVVINETMAHRLFRGQNPLGRMVYANRQCRVIGVVRDVRHSALDREAGMEFYFPHAQGEIESADLVVRTTLEPTALASAVRRAVWAFAPAQPLSDFRTLDQLVDTATSPRRFTTLLLGVFAIVALVLASVGIYGVIAYSVTQRTRELGIRMALGAGSGTLAWNVVREALVLSALGVLIGAAGLGALRRLLSGLLFAVGPTDPAVFTTTTAVLIGIAALAAWLPARQAARIDPVVALRLE